MKSFIESQFGYCPLTWMFNGRQANSRINRIHERALRIVYKDNTLSFQDLLIKDKSSQCIIEIFSISNRTFQSQK